MQAPHLFSVVGPAELPYRTMTETTSSGRRASVTPKFFPALADLNVITSSGAKSAQGNRVQQELEQLRQKQLAKSQRDRLKDCTSNWRGAPLYYYATYWLSFTFMLCNH